MDGLGDGWQNGVDVLYGWNGGRLWMDGVVDVNRDLVGWIVMDGV